ncbi:MAG: hypothetical protein B9S32_13100 [Verrucomicrobia bacterium Tous-C9LFEB]|nr:MAG: hypothetical protein B9S32_13100 [Verrucomicrobia bacterium Tous-C9LFEB]
MTYLAEQVGSVLLAVALFPVLLYLPGKILLFRFPFLRPLFPEALGAELLLSMAVAPITLYLLQRFAGPTFATLILVGLYIAFLPHRLPVVSPETPPVPRRNHRPYLIAALAWLALVIVMNVDLPCGNRLYAATTAFDWSKHVMVTDAIARDGIPPANPAFHPGETMPLCYYYLWHNVCAFFTVGSWISPRASVLASVFWAGVALFAVLHQFLSLLYPPDPTRHSSRRLSLLLLLSIGGLASLLLAIRVALYLYSGEPLRLDFLSVLHTGSDPVFGWLNTLITTPHHAAALVITLTGFLLLRTASVTELRSRRLPILLAGLAFASAAGMSLWIGMVAAAIAVVWLVFLLTRGDLREIALWLGAGAVAALAILPLFLELNHASQLTEAPLGFHIRGFTFTHALSEPWKSLIDFLCLPLNYSIEIGFPLLGALLIWRVWGLNASLTPHELFLRVMFWTSLILVSFVASTVRHNDFGWRGILFAQAVCVLWCWPLFLSLFPALTGAQSTLCARAAIRFPRLWKITLFALGFGFLSAVIDTLMVRCANALLDCPKLVTDAPYSSLALPDDHHTAERLAAYREGYNWLRQHTPRPARIALNPDHHVEAPFFLYANRQAIVADLYNSTMFGIRRANYEGLLARLKPLFAAKPPLWVDVRATLAPLGADYLVLRSDDPAWNHSSDWPTPLYHNAHLAVYDLGALPPTPRQRE